jgi:hypothetical protein
MNATTTNATTKPDDKKVAMPAGATTKPEACATTTTKPEACATTTAKPEACATASGKPEACGNTYDGKVVSISGNKLVMSNQEGKEFSHTVAADAKVCCDGTACRTEDLKVGAKIRLTTKADDKHVATKIESLDKQAEFVQAV